MSETITRKMCVDCEQAGYLTVSMMTPISDDRCIVCGIMLPEEICKKSFLVRSREWVKTRLEPKP